MKKGTVDQLDRLLQIINTVYMKKNKLVIQKRYNYYGLDIIYPDTTETTLITGSKKEINTFIDGFLDITALINKS
jgi:hypothetical protein